MTRIVPVVLLASIMTVPAAAQTTSRPQSWRLSDVNFADQSAFQLPGAKLGDTSRIGVGMFGFKTEQRRQKAVIAREIDAPRQRRAGIGLSLKF